MKVLFICKWNRFRSKAAEAIFNELNKNHENEARSAGFFPKLDLDQRILESFKKSKLHIEDMETRGITYPIMMWADKIVIVANDVPESLFDDIKKNDNKEIIKWDIPDVFGPSIEERVKSIKQIKERVRQLLENL